MLTTAVGLNRAELQVRKETPESAEAQQASGQPIDAPTLAALLRAVHARYAPCKLVTL